MVIFENKTFLNLHLKFCKKSTYMCSSVEFNVFIKEEVKNSLYTIYKETIQILNIFHLSKTKKNRTLRILKSVCFIFHKNGSKICNSFYCWESISWFTLKNKLLLWSIVRRDTLLKFLKSVSFIFAFTNQKIFSLGLFSVK